jgi:hypothetical protein
MGDWGAVNKIGTKTQARNPSGDDQGFAHMNALTSPPGLTISRDRVASAANLRARARMIEVQLGEDAPTTDGPYALHTEHPPPGAEAARMAFVKASPEQL